MKRVLLGLALILILIQFIRPARNEDMRKSNNDVTAKYATPANVKTSLQNACYDCHSNATNYPWYSNVQPVAWWLAEHIEDGKKHLNFSEFGTYPPKKAHHKMEEVIESQKEGWMPMEEYTWMHPQAKLTDAERQAIIQWAEGIRGQIAAANPEVLKEEKREGESH